MTIGYILCSFGTFFSGFGIMHLEKSGNPALKQLQTKPGSPVQEANLWSDLQFLGIFSAIKFMII
jgi:hypothetical protein